MNFWLIAGALTLIVALICFYPLLQSSRTNPHIERDKLNKAFYFDRLKELERDEQQGLLDNIEQLKTELQHSLLEDIPEQQRIQSAVKLYGKIGFICGFITLCLVGSFTYLKVGAWHQQNQLANTTEKLPYFYNRINSDNPSLTDDEWQQFATALRIKLQQDPKNAKDWGLLGQIGMILDNPQLALDSYGKAYKLDNNNHEYALGYAKILMFSEDAADKAQGEEILKGVLRQDHSNLDALSLLAFRFFENADYKMAAVTWGMMLRLIPEDDPRVPLLEKSIRAARDALQEKEEDKSEASHSP